MIRQKIRFDKTWICLRCFQKCFLTLYSGKPPSNHHLGEYVLLFLSILCKSKKLNFVAGWCLWYVSFSRGNSKVVSTQLWNTPGATFTNRLQAGDSFHSWRRGGVADWVCSRGVLSFSWRNALMDIHLPLDPKTMEKWRFYTPKYMGYGLNIPFFMDFHFSLHCTLPQQMSCTGACTVDTDLRRKQWPQIWSIQWRRPEMQWKPTHQRKGCQILGNRRGNGNFVLGQNPGRRFLRAEI